MVSSASRDACKHLFETGLVDVRLNRRSAAAHIPLFLYPFLNTVSKTKPFEYLRLTSLGVIGALVKVAIQLCSSPTLQLFCCESTHSHVPYQQLRDDILWQQMDDSDVINFLLSTEIIPLCLRIMETGSELSKTASLLSHGCRTQLSTSPHG